jgi:hypothetical protein
LVNELCRYWTLKRQWKRGAALTKRLQLALEMQPSHPSSLEETREKLDYYEGLLENLRVVQQLTELIREREDTKQEIARNQEMIVDLVNFPVQHLIVALWTKLVSAGANNEQFDSTIFSEIESKVNNRQYKQVDEFKNDLFGYLDSVRSESPRDSAIYRAATRMDKALSSAFSRAQARSQSISRHPDNKDITDFRNFDIKGLTVSQEIWSGIRVLREMSPFSDIDDDELYELEYGRRKRLRGELST